MGRVEKAPPPPSWCASKREGDPKRRNGVFGSTLRRRTVSLLWRDQGPLTALKKKGNQMHCRNQALKPRERNLGAHMSPARRVPNWRGEDIGGKGTTTKIKLARKRLRPRCVKKRAGKQKEGLS